MRQQLKNSIILFLIFGSYITIAVLEIVFVHTFRMLMMLGIMLAFAVIGILLGKWARDFKKIVDNLPADHKLFTPNIAAIDIGNIRFIYRVYEKGSGMSPVSKSYISMEVGIPFPEEDIDKGDYSARESIMWELQNLIDTLQDEGVLTEFNPIVQESTWLGQPYRLEFQLKSMTPSRMADIQDIIVCIIDKYRLQKVSWCIISGSKFGTEYRYHKGNLLQSTVLIRDTFDKNRSNYKEVASLHIEEFDHKFTIEGYFELYELASGNLGKGDLHFGDVKELTKHLFRGKQNKITRIAENSEDISVTVTIPKLKAASTYHLIHSDNRWWVFAEGRLDNIYPISTDDESSACDLLLRILNRIAESE